MDYQSGKRPPKHRDGPLVHLVSHAKFGSSHSSVHDDEFLTALRCVDFKKSSPRPDTPNHWKSSGRTLYLNFVIGLKEKVEHADLSDPREFHSFFWMITKFGADQKFIARAHHVSPTVVSRWLNGKQTPEPLRRKMILVSALASLNAKLKKKSVVPMKEYNGQRAPRLSENDQRLVVATG